jgi:hypothetical protein
MAKKLYLRTNLEPNSKKGNYKLVRSTDLTKYGNSLKRWSNNPTKLNEEKVKKAFNFMKKNALKDNKKGAKQYI